MKPMDSTTSVVVTAFFCAIFSFSGIAFAQTVRFDYPPAYKSITAQEQSTLERTSIIALRHITQARYDIYRKELTSARVNLERAEKLLATIKDDLSTSVVKNFIWIARKHLEYEPTKQVLRDFPQIYSALDMISVYIPTDKAKRYIDNAKVFLEKDKKFDADKELALADKSLIVIEVELPLLRVQRFITKAHEYLDKNEPDKAAVALKIAEQRAMALYFGMNSPLIQAKQNVWLAFRNYPAASRAETASHLNQARIHLDKSAVKDGRSGNNEVSKLSNEISVLEHKIAGEGKLVDSDLKAAWEKSAALAERSDAYLAAELSKAETTLGVESNLIEARLHVRYAETYQVTTSEPDKVVKELDTAVSYLKKAAGNILADNSETKKIHVIENILMDLKLTPKEHDKTVRDRYDFVVMELLELSDNEQDNNQIRSMQGM